MSDNYKIATEMIESIIENLNIYTCKSEPLGCYDSTSLDSEINKLIKVKCLMALEELKDGER